MDKAAARKMREANKAMCVASYILKTHEMCAKAGFAASMIEWSGVMQLQAITHTPAWCWRTDKPNVDKRRLKRLKSSLKRGYKLKPLLEQNFNLEVA